jgi:hypothetical protein
MEVKISEEDMGKLKEIADKLCISEAEVLETGLKLSTLYARSLPS